MRAAVTLAAAAAALTAAVPAQAAIYPVCATQLAAAADGQSATCTAGNAPQVSGAVTLRVFTVDVAQGAVVASISCGYGSYERSTSRLLYAKAQPQSLQVLENPSTTCRNTLTAYTGDTTAAGVSTWTYSFVGPLG